MWQAPFKFGKSPISPVASGQSLVIWGKIIYICWIKTEKPNMILDEKLPKYLLGKYQLVGTVTFSVLFAVVFLNIYIPFSETAWFRLGDSAMFTHTVVFIAMSILILICSRMLMYRSKSMYEMTYLAYIIWCILEILAISGFYTWFTTDITLHQYEDRWSLFAKALRNVSIALGLPYLISGMYFAIIDKNNTIRLMNYDNVVTDEPAKTESEKRKITLFDNNGALKLSLNLENLYYIESDDNYIKVWYTDSKGDLKQYILRCRLKTVEEDFKGSPLVRCHRKYIVNLNKVSMLRKESDGFVLDLENEVIPPISVTKTYADTVLSHFTEQSPLLEPMDD